MNEDELDYEDCLTDDECDAFFARRERAINQADPTRYECPRCGDDCLSASQKAKGYVCDTCVDKAESGLQY